MIREHKWKYLGVILSENIGIAPDADRASSAFLSRLTLLTVNLTTRVQRFYAFCSAPIQHLFMALKPGLVRSCRMTSIRLEWLTIGL